MTTTIRWSFTAITYYDSRLVIQRLSTAHGVHRRLCPRLQTANTVAAANRPDPIPHGARVLRLATRIAGDAELEFQYMKADVNVALLWRDPCEL